jgi:Putative DNA-binding domain
VTVTRPANSLDDLQHWMLRAVTDPAGVRTCEGLDETILPSRQQTAGERLAVYQHAYLARLLEVLREQFPCSRFAVGDGLFDQFAAGYLHGHPPHSYTLAHLADQLPEYLDATRPADWGDFLVELVGLERAIDRVFDGPGPENAAPFAFPADAGESLRLSLVPGCELHAFHYPVSTYYTDWKAQREPAWPEPREQFIALFRREYVVRRHELSRVQYELLQRLHDGETLSEALCGVGQPRRLPHGEASFDELADSVRDWFAGWTAGGFFALVSG